MAQGGSGPQAIVRKTKLVVSALGALALLLLTPRLPLIVEAPLAVVSVAPATPLRILTGTIERNATLARTLAGTLSPATIHALVEAARPVHDLARLSVGRPFGLTIGPDGLVAAFTYGIDELRTLRLTRRDGVLLPELVTRDYEVEMATATGAIASSLFAAVADSGEEDQLAIDLAEVFAWDIDFNTELQRGDSFRVAFEKLSLDGRFVRYGRILSAEFVRGARVLRAVRFDGASGGGYYAPDGMPLRKAFLRSPLKFTRISSGFSYSRFHPILGRATPHLGIDYAAPTGTPVQAAANGVVLLAGWMNGYGQTVRLRHANGYETLYGHLSRIDVRAGQRVTQGDRIGAVGATGLATGPHLDYRMTRNGTFLNPLTVELPPAEPVGDEDRPAFEATRDHAMALLERAPVRVQAASSAAPIAVAPEPNLRQ
jgi:murein DD-endopeptidase MepM/ murein hydrolase activator NlpD